MIDTNKFLWIDKGTKLYLGSEFIGEIVEQQSKDCNQSLWRIKFSNGDLSLDFYNKTRAQENLIRLTQKERNV